MELAALALALLAAGPAWGSPLLHPMFADHAVLQRGQPIRVYGQAPSGTDIRVQLGNQSATARATADGQWSATLPAMPRRRALCSEASGDGESQQINDVLVGDVFLCTGQSNMQLSVRRAANAGMRDRRRHRWRGARIGGGPRRQPSATRHFFHARELESGVAADGGRFFRQLFLFRATIAQACESPGRPGDGGLGRHPRPRLGERARLARTWSLYDDLDMLALYQRDPAAASRRWDAAWENAWRAQAKDQPWKADTSSWPVAPQDAWPLGQLARPYPAGWQRRAGRGFCRAAMAFHPCHPDQGASRASRHLGTGPRQ